MVTGAGVPVVERVSDFTQASQVIKRNGSRRHRPREWGRRSSEDRDKEKFALSACPQDFHVSSTGFPQGPAGDRIGGGRLKDRMRFYVRTWLRSEARREGKDV